MFSRFFLPFFLFTFVGVGFSQSNSKSVLVFETYEINREDIPYDSKIPFVFVFTNKGKKPVVVNEVKTSCGCTAAEKPTAPVGKKKKGKISVTYDTKRVGVFVKTITVFPEGLEPITLTIKGNILPETKP